MHSPWVIIEHRAPANDYSVKVRALAKVVDAERTEVCLGDHSYVASRWILHEVFKFVRRLTDEENRLFLGDGVTAGSARMVRRTLQERGTLYE